MRRQIEVETKWEITQFSMKCFTNIKHLEFSDYPKYKLVPKKRKFLLLADKNMPDNKVIFWNRSSTFYNVSIF